MTTAAILLPSVYPDLYQLAAMRHADVAVWHDLARFSRKSTVHRGRIRTPDGTHWLSVPFLREDRNKPINKVRIDQKEDWATIHLRTLEYNYRNSPYFDFYEPEIRADFEAASRFEFLIELIRHNQERIWQYLYLEQDARWSSKLESPTADIDQLAENLGADTVIQEPDSRHFQQQAQRMGGPDFHLPEYRQHFEGFQPGCCLLDLLFQYGPSSWEITDRI